MAQDPVSTGASWLTSPANVLAEDDSALALIAEMTKLQNAINAVSDRAEKFWPRFRKHPKGAGSRLLGGRDG